MDQLIARLEHAWGHCQRFNAEVSRFLDDEPYRIWSENKPDSGEYLVWIEHDPSKPIPPHLGFIAGDCIHNIRSTLDNLVWALPGANPDRAAFVIFETDPAEESKPLTFVKKATRLHGIPQSAVDLIESLQPYKRTQNSSGSNIPIGILLLWLDKLWNRDKHRTPTVALNATLGGHVVLPHNSGWIVTEQNSGTFDRRRVVVRLRRGNVHRGETKIETNIPVDVAFEYPPTPILRAGILTYLHNCVRDDVLPLFRPFL